MKKTGIVSETATGLPKELIEKHQIGQVPVKLDWPDLDRMPGENTFQKMRELEKRGIKSFGKTSQPSPKAYLDVYKKQLETCEKVICVTVTSKLSGSYNSALQAIKFLNPQDQGRIIVVDSLSANAGQAFLILRAIELIEKGKEAEDIKKELDQMVAEIHTFLIFKDPKYIEASGRISKLAANMLRSVARIGIRPVLTFKNGLLVPAGIKTGAKDISTAMFKTFEDDVAKSKKQPRQVLICHGDDLAAAERLKDMIEKQSEAEVLYITIIDNILGSISGPETLILGWI